MIAVTQICTNLLAMIIEHIVMFYSQRTIFFWLAAFIIYCEFQSNLIGYVGFQIIIFKAISIKRYISTYHNENEKRNRVGCKKKKHHKIDYQTSG